ncbi:4580_t:CDS:2, partial [Funneliformis mosseae]
IQKVGVSSKYGTFGNSTLEIRVIKQEESDWEDTTPNDGLEEFDRTDKKDCYIIIRGRNTIVNFIRDVMAKSHKAIHSVQFVNETNMKPMTDEANVEIDFKFSRDQKLTHKDLNKLPHYIAVIKEVQLIIDFSCRMNIKEENLNGSPFSTFYTSNKA